MLQGIRGSAVEISLHIEDWLAALSVLYSECKGTAICPVEIRLHKEDRSAALLVPYSGFKGRAVAHCPARSPVGQVIVGFITHRGRIRKLYPVYPGRPRLNLVPEMGRG